MRLSAWFCGEEKKIEEKERRRKAKVKVERDEKTVIEANTLEDL